MNHFSGSAVWKFFIMNEMIDGKIFQETKTMQSINCYRLRHIECAWGKIDNFGLILVFKPRL